MTYKGGRHGGRRVPRSGIQANGECGVNFAPNRENFLLATFYFPLSQARQDLHLAVRQVADAGDLVELEALAQ